MKIITLTLFCCLISNRLAAQKQEFDFISDTLFHLNGADTAYFETFHFDGKVRQRQWKQDSTHLFEKNGQLQQRILTHISHIFQAESWLTHSNLPPEAHQLWTYYPNNAIHIYKFWANDSTAISNYYAPNGQLLSEKHWTKFKGNRAYYYQNYCVHITQQRKVKSIFTDTLNKIRIDSSFYNNGLCSDVWKRSYGNEAIHRFDSTGNLIYQYLSDTNRIHPDKDNLNCVYGFRNENGNWVVAPQYDEVQQLENKYKKNIYYIVSKQGQYGILDAFGTLVLPLEYDYLKQLSNRNRFVEPTNEVGTSDNTFFKYRKKGKYGVIDLKGKILLEAQFEDVRKIHKTYFEVQHKKKWGIVDKNKNFIVQPAYLEVHFTNLPTLFITADSVTEADWNTDTIAQKRGYSYYSEAEIVYGLANHEGKILLKPAFQHLQLNKHNAALVEVTARSIKQQKVDGGLSITAYTGLFDLKKGWILEPIYTKVEGVSCEVKWQKGSIISQKWGCLDTNGQKILPFEYDSMAKVTFPLAYQPLKCKNETWLSCFEKKDVLICRKNKKFGVYDVSKSQWLIPLNYDFIECHIGEDYTLNHSILFFALQAGKWIQIDKNGNVLNVPSMDYVGWFNLPIPANDFQQILFTVRDRQVQFWYDAFYEKPFPIEIVLKKYKKSFIPLNDFAKGRFLIHKTGQLATLPTDEVESIYPNYAIIRNNNQRFLIDTTGNKRLFMPQYKIISAQFEQGIIFVKDTITHRFGVMATDGKTILPCHYYAISELAHPQHIWAKARPNFQFFSDTHNRKYTLQPLYDLIKLDSGWQVFNTKGRLLTKTLFAFPFDMSVGHGIGTICESADESQIKMGIWKFDGTNILPAVYDRIYFDPIDRLYFIYLRTPNGKEEEEHWRIGVCDTTGIFLIEPTFQNMSFFQGGYAIVTTQAGFGLVRRDGSFKIAPQQHAFRQTEEDIESLRQMYFKKRDLRKKQFPQTGLKFGVSANPIYSELNDTLKRQVRNLVIEKMSDYWFLSGARVPFNRLNTTIHFQKRATYSVDNNFDEGDESDNDDESDSEETEPNTDDFYAFETRGWSSRSFMNRESEKIITSLAAQSNYISFILRERWLGEHNRFMGTRSFFYNFLREGDDWREVTIENLLDLKPDNYLKINELVLRKIQFLKDAHMDCSNPISLFLNMKNNFLITKDGLEFEIGNQFIALSNAELKPFFKN